LPVDTPQDIPALDILPNRGSLSRPDRDARLDCCSGQIQFLPLEPHSLSDEGSERLDIRPAEFALDEGDEVHMPMGPVVSVLCGDKGDLLAKPLLQEQ